MVVYLTHEEKVTDEQYKNIRKLCPDKDTSDIITYLDFLPIFIFPFAMLCCIWTKRNVKPNNWHI